MTSDVQIQVENGIDGIFDGIEKVTLAAESANHRADIRRHTQLPKCHGCHRDLEIGLASILEALGYSWHQDCFRCDVCNCRLSRWYCERDGLILCQQDYKKKFHVGDCKACNLTIFGPLMVAGDHHFHPECFKCSSCAGVIGAEEPFTLLERTHLFCSSCYKKSCPTLLQAPSYHQPHAIHLVQLPSSADRSVRLTEAEKPVKRRRTKPRRPCVRITSLHGVDSSVQVGDRILEVNGEPVLEKSLSEVDELVKNADVLWLTVERENSLRHQSPHSPDHTGSESDSEKSPRRVERSTSLPKGGISPQPPAVKKTPDINRSQSYRASSGRHRVFRTCDLHMGDVLGRGFFGHAIKVTHKLTGEVMVLKELHHLSEEAHNSFLKEVSVLRNLDHPNVLRFLGVLFKDKHINLITQYVGGGTLHDRLLNHDIDIAWVQRAAWAQHLADGMAYLHAKNIIHRDLNSMNCLLQKDDTLIVADFGLARIVPQPVEHVKSSSSPESSPDGDVGKKGGHKKKYTVVGSPYWMAPEMINGQVYDEKVDVFSYGIVVCEMIGRVKADPDYLPRKIDFSLDRQAFHMEFCQHCPPPFFKLAVISCQMIPEDRPAFSDILEWIQALNLHLHLGTPVPSPLQGDPLLYQPDSEVVKHSRKLSRKEKALSIINEVSCD